MRFVLATHNEGKVRDISDLFRESGHEFVSAGELNLSSPPETEDTLLGNAMIKARSAFRETGLPVIADDSGFFVDELDGAPGVFTADWAETANGVRDYAIARKRVLDRLEEKGVKTPTSASFRTVIILMISDEEHHVFEGKVDGHFVWPPRGDKGYDMDSVFVPEGDDRTFGEMTTSEKNGFNSRSIALEKMFRHISENDSDLTP